MTVDSAAWPVESFDLQPAGRSSPRFHLEAGSYQGFKDSRSVRPGLRELRSLKPRRTSLVLAFVLKPADYSFEGDWRQAFEWLRYSGSGNLHAAEALPFSKSGSSFDGLCRNFS